MDHLQIMFWKLSKWQNEIINTETVDQIILDSDAHSRWRYCLDIPPTGIIC
jgi:hypothetical protein